VGGQRELIIPPELAYGDNELPEIPANSTLIFECELVAIGAPEKGLFGRLFG